MFASNNFSFFASVENCYFGKAFRARISEIRGKEKSRSERVDRVVKADARIEGIIQRNLENGKLQNNVYAFWQKCDFAQYRFQAKYRIVFFGTVYSPRHFIHLTFDQRTFLTRVAVSLRNEVLD